MNEDEIICNDCIYGPIGKIKECEKFKTPFELIACEGYVSKKAIHRVISEYGRGYK